MEFTIKEKKSSICLNMIVKNESHIILNTLEKLCNKINFDYWVICDTGSTDNTPQIITDFFNKKGIKGELYYDEWVNFGHNRTLALQRAHKKTELLLVFDADDEIIGDIKLPEQVLFDEYHLKFGSQASVSYTRVLLINNYKQFEYLSVIHEFIACKEPGATSTVIEGDYFVVSGRTGSRNQDPDKYLKDALILEKAHKEALKKNDQLYHRYAFYCANSYKDCGKFEEAIKWYIITINQEKQWNQEKYTSCLYIYDCYTLLNKSEMSFFYLVKAFSYDPDRVECLFPLLVHYCCENMHRVAYNYYLNVKDYFENRYLEDDISKKLFTVIDKFNFYVPYYMILIADKVQDFKCVVRMYEIIFTKKQCMFEEWYIKNVLYNLQFFIQHVPSSNTQFIPLANEYVKFLYNNGVNFNNFDFLNNEIYTNAGIILDYTYLKKIIVTDKINKFSEEECKKCKNILIYTGFSDLEWNDTYISNNAIGGSEKAVAYLSKCFPKDYNIFISGHVKNETIDNIKYIHLDQLTKLIEIMPFHTVIVSRYISFYEMFKNCSFYQNFIWAHDILLLPYGCNLLQNQILLKWNKYIDGCICLTEWHRNLFLEKYPELKDKIYLINNGIDNKLFNSRINKIPNKFIYSSRPDRGLDTLIDLWPKILEQIPDASLTISTYGSFPCNPEEILLKNKIDQFVSINYLGNLNTEKLYEQMATAEYWLYPTNWPETSCITALEMLRSEVICLYYPVAGLQNTIDKYGIKLIPDKEIEAFVSLTNEQKTVLKENGRIYAESCSWSNRFNTWNNLLFTNINQKKNDTIILYTANCISEVIDEYIIVLKEKYNIEHSNDILYIIKSNPLSVLFIGSIHDKDYELIKHTIPLCKISLLNLEPLNLEPRITNLLNIYSNYKMKIYDYSLTNISILNDNKITDVEFLPYTNIENETQYLKQLNNETPKIYDFGILTGCGAPNNSINELGPKRRKLVEYLLSLGFTVNIIKAWKEERDKEFAKCKIILNIHGQLLHNDYWLNSNIFEHLRCNRLLNAGFNVLSEQSYDLSTEFIDTYNNLKIIPYMDFYKPETYSNLYNLNLNLNTLKNKKNYCFIHSCNIKDVGTGRLEYLIHKIEESKAIDIFDKIYIYNIGIPIQTNYGSKYILTNYHTDPTLFEAPTLNKIQEFSCNNNDCNILYIHTKGIRYNVNDQKENDWIDFMLYFLLDKSNECIQKLNEEYDVVGCNYHCKYYKNVPPHFSGNFWWANTKYLKTLPRIDENLRERQIGEFLLFKKNPLFYCIYNSNIDHYTNNYPERLYKTNEDVTINKDVTINENLGFIILRNVTSEDTNKYWIECYNSIRRFYPDHAIVIVDVSNEKSYIFEKKLFNTVVVDSKHKGTYNIIPYLYYLENKPFLQAVIIKDTMFFTKYIKFDNENHFLWHFEHAWDDDKSEIELITNLDNFLPLLQLYLNKSLWKGCLDAMSVISYDFLQKIHTKYNFYKAFECMNSDQMNSSFERIFAIMFIIEYGGEYKESICGDFIWTTLFTTTHDKFIINKPNPIHWLSPITKIFSHEFL